MNARIMSPPLFRLERMCNEEGAMKKLDSPIAKTSFHFTASDLKHWRYHDETFDAKRLSACLLKLSLQRLLSSDLVTSHEPQKNTYHTMSRR